MDTDPGRGCSSPPRPAGRSRACVDEEQFCCRTQPLNLPRQATEDAPRRLWVSGSLGLWVSGSLGLWVSGSLGLWVSGSLVQLLDSVPVLGSRWGRDQIYPVPVCACMYGTVQYSTCQIEIVLYCTVQHMSDRDCTGYTVHVHNRYALCGVAQPRLASIMMTFRLRSECPRLKKRTLSTLTNICVVHLS
jgi:hypothetical protein